MGRQKHFSFFSVVWPLKNPEFPLSCTAYVDQEIIWYPMKPRICTCVNAPNRIRTDISRFRSHFGRICFYIYSALFLAPYYSLKKRKLFSLPPFFSHFIQITFLLATGTGHIWIFRCPFAFSSSQLTPSVKTIHLKLIKRIPWLIPLSERTLCR